MKKFLISIFIVTLLLVVTSFLSGFRIPTSGKELKLKACNEACQNAYEDCKKKKPKLACDVALETCKKECKKKHS
jgi:uncharacterized membrane protein